MMAKNLLLRLSVLLVAFAINGSKANEDYCELSQISNKTSLDICFNLFDSFETALLQNRANAYILRKAFFYSPLAAPVLLKVNYNVTHKFQSDCHSPDANTTLRERSVTYTNAWTSTGIFVVFHPALLNIMQFQLPFAFIRMFHAMNNRLKIKTGPHIKTLLWDSMIISEIPSIMLQLNVTSNSLPCVPSQALINETLKDVTSQLREYTHTHLEFFGKERNFSSKEVPYEYVGYGLNRDAVSIEGMLHYEYTGALYGIYYTFSLVSYFVIVFATIAMLIISKESIPILINKFCEHNEQLYKPAAYVSIGVIGLELLLDVILRMAWAVCSKDKGAIYGLILLTIVCHWIGTISVTIWSRRYFCPPSSDQPQGQQDEGHQQSGTAAAGTTNADSDLSASVVPPDPSASVVPPDSSASVVPPDLSASVVLPDLGMTDAEKNCKKCFRNQCTKVLLYTIAVLILLMIFVAGYGLVYILALAKTGVISFGPLVIVSLLPSVGISVISYIAKRKIFAKPKENKEVVNSPTTPHEYQHIYVSLAVFMTLSGVSLFLHYSVPTFILMLAYTLDVITVIVYTGAAYFGLIIAIAILTKMLAPNLHLHLPQFGHIKLNFTVAERDEYMLISKT